MARLYSLADAIAHDDPEYGHFVRKDDGGFAFPDDLSDTLLRFHVRGRPLWEDQIQRQQRVASEDLARQRDPAYLAGLVAQLVASGPQATSEADMKAIVAKAVAEALAAVQAPAGEAAAAEAPPKATTRKTAAKTAGGE